MLDGSTAAGTAAAYMTAYTAAALGGTISAAAAAGQAQTMHMIVYGLPAAAAAAVYTAMARIAGIHCCGSAVGAVGGAVQAVVVEEEVLEMVLDMENVEMVPDVEDVKIC